MMMAMRAISAAAGLAIVLGGAARADDPPDPKDLQTVQACLKAKGASDRDREGCADVVSRACIGPDESANPPSALIECFGREQLVWDQMLNQAFRKLRDGLDDKQCTRLRDMQRSWVDTRDRTCAFYYDYFQGSMANPMMANCTNRETARRAIFLMGFADDMAGWVRDKR
jgi:uncharacterized protein YecT (DUF1311 family)